MMKKTKIVELYTILLILGVINSCTKVDNNPPVITLKGSNPDTLTLNAIYYDPGVTAIDDVTGNLNDRITFSWLPEINKDSAATYHEIYTVVDANGNRDSVVRTVIVNNNAAFFYGKYTANGNCDNIGPMSFYSEVRPSSFVNNNILFYNFGGFGSNIIDSAKFDPNTNQLTFFSGQSLGGSKTIVSGFGTVSGISPNITLNINYSWTTGFATDNCSITYIK